MSPETEPAPPRAPQQGSAEPASTVSLIRPGTDTSIGPPPTLDRAAASLASQTAPRICIPNYEILAEVARGGMGVVYKARHAQLDRTVALKMILSGQFAGPEQVECFKAEARAAAQLEHSGIVPIYEIGEYEGQNFFAMQFVSGGTLADKLAAGPLAPQAAAELLQQVAEAVHHAHTRGIVHRDLKPGNVLLDDDGHPKVTDFGLAKQLEGTRGISLTGDVMGTPPYMAPEQAAGKVHEIGPLADVYALGAILYAALTGRPPFQAATLVETLRQVSEQEPVSPRLVNGAVNQDLETICLKCLHKEPARRYASAADLAADLGRFLRGEPILARPVGRVEHAVRWCRRNPLPTALVGTVAAAILTVLVTLSISYFRISSALANEAAEHTRANAATISERTAKNKAIAAASSERKAKHDAVNAAARESKAKHEAIEANAQTTRAKAVAETALASAETNLAHSRLRLALQHWRNSDVPEASLLLDRCPPELRRWEWNYVRRLCSSDLWREHSRGNVCNAAYSADDRWLVAGIDTQVHLWNAQTESEQRTISTAPHAVKQVAISADSSRLAVLLGSTIRILDRASDEVLVEIPDVLTTLRNRVTFSPDGRWLLAPQGAVYEVETGLLAVDPLPACQDAVWAPSGEWFAASDAQTIFLRTPGGDELRKITPATGMLAVSPDSQKIARGWLDGVDLVSAADGSVLQSLRGITDSVQDIAFSRDGTRLAVAGGERTVRVWNLTEGELQATLRGHESQVFSVAFRGDGVRLASVSREAMRVWEPASDPETIRWNTGGGMKSFDPTGHKIASADGPDGYTIYEAATRRVLQKNAAAGNVMGTAFSPDGKLLLTGGPQGIAIWNAETGDRAGELAAPMTNQIAIHSGGARVVSTGDDNIVRLWDLANRAEIATQAMPTKIYRLQFVPRSSQVAILVAGRIVLWDTERTDQATILPCERVIDFDLHQSQPLLAVAHATDFGVQIWNLPDQQLLAVLPAREAMGRVAFHPTEQRVAASSGAASAARQTTIWDVTTRQELVAFRERGLVTFLGQLAFSPSGNFLLGHGSIYTRLWDGRPKFNDFVLAGHNAEVSVLAFSPDGQRLISGSFDRTLRVWELAHGNELALLRGAKQTVRSAAIDPTGKWVVAAGDAAVRFWNLDGTKLRQWPGDELLVSELALSPDGQTVALISGNQVRLHDAASGEQRRSFDFTAAKYCGVLYAPRGDLLLMAGGDERSGVIYGWNLATGEKRFETALAASPSGLAFAPDGERFAAGLLDGTVQICDSQTGLPGQTHVASLPLTAVAWSPDGKWLAAGGQNFDVWIWNAKTNELVATLHQPRRISALVFSPDSRHLAIGTFDGLIRLVPADWAMATAKP